MVWGLVDYNHCINVLRKNKHCYKRQKKPVATTAIIIAQIVLFVVRSFLGFKKNNPMVWAIRLSAIESPLLSCSLV